MTLTDIQSIGLTTFLANPILLPLIGIILWLVLIGIISLSN